MWDAALGLPVPPVDAVAPTGFSAWCAGIYASITVVALLFSLWHWRSSRRPVLLLIVLGGGMTGFVEPLVDLLGACWHPRLGHGVAYEFMGRPIPWWIVAVYFAYFGVLGIWNYAAFTKGATMRTIRLWFLVPMLADVVVELIMLPKGLYIYYGQQPLVVFGWLPLWWVPCNSIGEFLGISLAVLMVPHLRGWKLLWLLVIMPVADVVGYGIIAMPSWIVINTPSPYWLVQLGGLTTFVLAFLTVHVVSLVLGTDSPLRKGSATAEQTLLSLTPQRT